MTTSRIVRGTKAKILVYICTVLIITGVIACYNNTLSQLDDIRKSNDICHQQEENLSTQLQVISDYKQKLENSLKSEKVEHQQTKKDFENKLNEEKSKNEKSNSESNLRFNSLQQHFNLLQTQHDDFKEESSKTQNKQMNEINDLQAKLKEVQEELKKVISSKENLKTQYLQIQIDKERLEKEVKFSQNANMSTESKMNSYIKINHDLQRELDSLKEKCSGYDTIQSPNQVLENTQFSNNNNNNNQEEKLNDKKSVGEEPPLQEEKSVLAIPGGNLSDLKNVASSKSTTASSIKQSSQGSLNGARPLLIPTITPESANNKLMPMPEFKSSTAKKLPEGVVPLPIEKRMDEEKNDLVDETINNRYRNKISAELKENSNNRQEEIKIDDVVDKENVANEVFDQPIQQQQQQHDDNLGFGDVNEHVKNAEKQNFNKQHIDSLGAPIKDSINNNNNNNNNNKVYDGADYKDLQNDVQLEENDPEEDDDADEYRDALARQKDPAVRH